MKRSVKILCAVLALVLALGCGVGGTLAFLAAKTNDVVNQFTFGDLSVKLEETTSKYQIVPGTNIPKDPKASVEAVPGTDPIDAYLFVEIKEENWPTAKNADGSRKVEWKIAEGWTAVEGETNVYYREVPAEKYGTKYDVLLGNQVTVDGSLTKAEVDAAKGATPKLTFTAYAVQKANLSVADAWKQAPSGELVPAV